MRAFAPPAAPTLPIPGAVPIVPLPATVSTPPIAQLTPAAPQLGRIDAATAASVPEPRGTISLSVSVTDSPPTVAEPLRAARRRQRRALAIAAGAVAVAIATVAVIVASGGDGATPERAAPPPADAPAPTSAIAIVTEPAGATITIDGTARGAAPLNVAVPVGAAIEIRAELADHASSSERVLVGTTPATVRLTLPPLVDAGVLVDAAPMAAPVIDAGTRRVRPRATREPAGGGFDPDGVVQP